MGADADAYEPVLEVMDYFDGPREGVAHFRGVPHRFQSRFLDATEYKGDFESVDIFELVPVCAKEGAAPILAHATFRIVGADRTTSLRELEVRWQVIERS